MAVRAYLPELVGLGSGPRPDGLPEHAWASLPRDAVAHPSIDPTAGGALHWAPLRDPGMQARTVALASWAAAHAPELLVVDVSVEVALTARLLAVPTIVVAQHGDRSDAPHALAYRSAAAVAALWPAGAVADPPGTQGRLHHIGPMSRFDGRLPAAAPLRRSARRQALLMLGRGGHDLAESQIAEAVEATTDGWTWELLGDGPSAGMRRADADDVWQALCAADVVIAPASNNCIGEAAAARRPLIVLPQDRPFDEQRAHASILRRKGLATVLQAWPQAEAWPALLQDVSAQPAPAWAAHHDGRGAERMADLIRRTAATT